MRNKYKKENVDVIDSVWGKSSAKLGSQGLSVYTDAGGQEIIAAEYQITLSIKLVYLSMM